MRTPSPAMIVALIALFISLGGASYAVVTLPEHSVGPRQLQSGAVTIDALRFLLGAASATDSTQRSITKTVCNGARRPGEVVNVLCPKEGVLSGLLGNVPTLHIYARRPGDLAILGTVGLDKEGPSGTRATVTYAVTVNGAGAPLCNGNPRSECITQVEHSLRRVTLLGGQQEQAPVESLVAVPRGSLTVQLLANATYSSYEGGDVIVGPVTLTAVLLP